MNLYILRHASAGTRRTNPLLDIKRPLDKEGKEHCLHLAHVLNALKITFDTVISSPLKRSLQTAQLVATETGFEHRILQSSALAPEASFADFTRLLDQHQKCESLLVVGHSPNIQIFLGSLLVPQKAAADLQPAQIRLRKGSIARVSLTRGPAILSSLLDPRTVKALSRVSTSRGKPSRSKSLRAKPSRRKARA